MSSLLEIKFWNKRSSASNFMITAPHTLDNYFRSQLSRIRGGHLPVPIEFNNVVNNQSLQYALCNKLRRMKLSTTSEHSEHTLQKQIKFVNKHTYDIQSLTIEQLFNYFIKYKSQQLAKALRSDNLKTSIIKPFIKIYVAVCQKQYSVDFNTNQKTIQSLNKLFCNILNDKHFQNKKQKDEQNQEYYFRSTGFINQKAKVQADKMLKSLQNKFQQQQKKNQEQIKIKKEPKKLVNNQPCKTKDQNLPKNVQNTAKSTKSGKKIRFNATIDQKNQDIFIEDDDTNICYQLGLLISDTDRILKPVQQDYKIVTQQHLYQQN